MAPHITLDAPAQPQNVTGAHAMKLYHGKGSCSIGILVLLEEIGVEYELASVDLAGGEQRSEAYRRLSPKAKVPLLELADGATITEWTAIAAYLAALRPEARLLPTDPLTMARVLELVDYIVATVHMQGFTRMVRPGAFTPNAADFEAVITRGREIFDGGLELLGAQLAGADDAVGAFSIADAALFYVERWKAERLGEALPVGLASHYANLLRRPSVQRALAL
jgi:glutathione S-transferase